MSTDPLSGTNDPDLVMVKADALIHRHHARSLSGLDNDLPMLEEVLGEDLPLLEDVAEPAFAAAPPGQAAAPLPADSRLEELEARHAEQIALLEAEQAATLARLARAEQALEAATHLASATKMQVAEQLIEFDAHLAQNLEAWISRELPQILARELDGLRDRIRTQTLAQLHATLIPELSEKLSETLDVATRDESRP
ncbi:hypothetical protein [Niveibacterium terrae]|uniref:hypothetical protein n=1 Tax=Niveibacterium terrae TaxID=3373598 RepID=UPI003A8D5A14